MTLGVSGAWRRRLLVPYMAQAVLMYERGEASARDIDVAMKLGTGVPMVRVPPPPFPPLTHDRALARGAVGCDCGPLTREAPPVPWHRAP